MNTPLTEERFEQILTKKLAPRATKADVQAAVDDLARIIADTIATPFTERFNQLEELLKVKDDVEQLKRQMLEIRSALHLSN
jgi:hypothetical protein